MGYWHPNEELTPRQFKRLCDRTMGGKRGGPELIIPFMALGFIFIMAVICVLVF